MHTHLFVCKTTFIRVAITFYCLFSLNFPWLIMFSDSNFSAKSNIDNFYPFTKYGHKMCNVNIFKDICKTISFFPDFSLTLIVFHNFLWLFLDFSIRTPPPPQLLPEFYDFQVSGLPLYSYISRTHLSICRTLFIYNSPARTCPSRSMVARICSEPGVMVYMDLALTPRSMACLAMLAARPMSS